MGSGLERACREARNKNIEEYKRKKRMINWTSVNDEMPSAWGHYFVFTTAGFPQIQEARYYQHGEDPGYFLVEGVIVDALYWAEANFPEEYSND